MAAPSVFGEIPGYPVGTHFESREAVRLAGLHRHAQGGISGNYEDGADAIVVSGGYVDDRDYGDRIVYTGQGGQSNGRQVADQTLTRGNLALVRSEQRGLPVRVIRGATGDSHSPQAGYRYDGLFVVTGHWVDKSIDGPRIWRFTLESADGGASWENTGAAPAGESSPGRATSVIQRVIRNSAVTQWVKDLHGGVCQFCGIALATPAGVYSEGAHVRALGAPHGGPDKPDNVLCLCPNDHVLFDKGALYVEGAYVYRSADRAQIGELCVDPRNVVDPEHFAYHREHIAGIS